jgi:Fe-coproporphyrin III synthase
VTPGQDSSGVLMLHLLGRCNLECVHCYMEGSPRRREQLALDSVLHAIRECPALGVGTLILTGGEPLLYRGLDQILDAAAQVTGLATTLCTNGTLLTDHRAARLRECGARVNISIDGRPEFHDRFRGFTGSFQASERGASAAVNAGVPVTIISTISQANLDAVEYLLDWAVRAGADQFSAQPLLNLGRGTNVTQHCLTFPQVNRLILQLTDLANQPRNRRIRCQVIGARRKFLLDHPCGAFVCNGSGCHRGVAKEIKKLVVREDGTVLPEVPNLSRRYSLGNVHDAPLGELVHRYFQQGYREFDQLCRTAYAEVLGTWDCVIVPWEQIIAERSQCWTPGQNGPALCADCVSCATSSCGTLKAPMARA